MAGAEKLTTTVSTKGQVILPSAIRQRREWRAGTRLTVEDTPAGVLLKPAPAFAETRRGGRVRRTGLQRQAEDAGRDERGRACRSQAPACSRLIPT